MNSLLKSLCSIHSPSGEEACMHDFILNYVHTNSSTWKVRPGVISGEEFQDCLILVFGNPEVAAVAHMDTTGFTVRYQDQLIPIGGPEVSGGEILTGTDELGEIECTLELNEEGQLHYKFGRAITSGTSLVFKNTCNDDDAFYHAPYLDNRIGIFNLLTIAEHLEHGVLVFSCWEEHGGGSIPFLVKYLYEQYRISKMLISDVTWVSDGIDLEKGVVVSYRDKNIPRKSFIAQITSLIQESEILYQVEVEAYGSSDAREIQQSPYPIDWCFIGPPVKHAHSSLEKVAKKDVSSMISMYQLLMNKL